MRNYIEGGWQDTSEEKLYIPGMPAIDADQAEAIARMLLVADALEERTRGKGLVKEGKHQEIAILTEAAHRAFSAAKKLVLEEAEKINAERSSALAIESTLDKAGIPFEVGIKELMKEAAAQCVLDAMDELGEVGAVPELVYGRPVVASRRASAYTDDMIHTCHYRSDIFIDVNPDGSGVIFSSKGILAEFDDYDGYHAALGVPRPRLEFAEEI